MRMSKKYRTTTNNNNSDNPMTSRRTNGGKNLFVKIKSVPPKSDNLERLSNYFSFKFRRDLLAAQSEELIFLNFKKNAELLARTGSLSRVFF